MAQAAQFVESGNAQVGLISLTLASSQHYKEVGRLCAGAGVAVSGDPAVRGGAQEERPAGGGAAFLDWLLSSEIQSKLPNVGLEGARVCEARVLR